MSLRERRHRRRAEVSLEMTPLIDVVFLLLIFFLITTTFSKSHEAQIPINLPQAVTGKKATAGEKVVLFVTKDGQVELKGEKAVTGATLKDKLADLRKQNPHANVVLKGDKQATHGKIIEVLDELKQSGFEKVDLVIAHPSSK